MAAASSDIQSYLVTWLNSPSTAWPLTGWTAAKTWDPTVSLEVLETDGLKVQVTFDGWGPWEFVSRAMRRREGTAYIDIRHKYGATGAIAESWVNERAELVEEIHNRLFPDTEVSGRPTGQRVWLINAVIDPLCDPPDLKELRQFTATIELTFAEVKQR